MRISIFFTVLIVFLSSAAQAQPYIDVSAAPYSAVCDGVADDTAKIQDAINVAQSSGVAIYVPKTSNGCRITSTLNIIWSVKIIGAGTMPYKGGPIGDSSRGPGSWLFFDHAGIGLRIVNAPGNPISGVLISDIGTRRRQPSPGSGDQPFTPCDCDYDFQIIDADVQLDNVTALNPTRLAYVDNTGVSRFIVNNLRSQPLRQGIVVHRAYEMVRLNGISFWPFWASLPNVNAYTLRNRNALWLFRVDNPQVSNFFSIFDNACIVFDYTSDGESGNGITSRFKGQNIDCDLNASGVFVSAAASGVTAQFSNFETLQSSDWTGTTANVTINGAGAAFDFTNARFSNARGNAVAISSASSSIEISNVWVENWNRANAGHAAFYISSGSSVSVSPPPRATGGNGASIYAGTGTKLQAGMIPQ